MTVYQTHAKFCKIVRKLLIYICEIINQLSHTPVNPLKGSYLYHICEKMKTTLLPVCRVNGKSIIRNSKYLGIAIPLISLKSPIHYRILRRSDQTQNKTLTYVIFDYYETENSKKMKLKNVRIESPLTTTPL